jgi:hypothetical protein
VVRPPVLTLKLNVPLTIGTETPPAIVVMHRRRILRLRFITTAVIVLPATPNPIGVAVTVKQTAGSRSVVVNHGCCSAANVREECSSFRIQTIPLPKTGTLLGLRQNPV